jgi:hypothetical protein
MLIAPWFPVQPPAGAACADAPVMLPHVAVEVALVAVELTAAVMALISLIRSV